MDLPPWYAIFPGGRGHHHPIKKQGRRREIDFGDFGDGNNVKAALASNLERDTALGQRVRQCFLDWGGRNIKQRGAPDDNMDSMQVGDGFVLVPGSPLAMANPNCRGYEQEGFRVIDDALPSIRTRPIMKFGRWHADFLDPTVMMFTRTRRDDGRWGGRSWFRVISRLRSSHSAAGGSRGQDCCSCHGISVVGKTGFWS